MIPPIWATNSYVWDPNSYQSLEISLQHCRTVIYLLQCFCQLRIFFLSYKIYVKVWLSVLFQYCIILQASVPLLLTGLDLVGRSKLSRVMCSKSSKYLARIPFMSMSTELSQRPLMRSAKYLYLCK